MSLPVVIGATADITDGAWSIRALRRRWVAEVDRRHSDQKLNDTQFFVVMIDGRSTEGGSGEATFRAILDHGPFPPTIRGVIQQP